MDPTEKRRIKAELRRKNPNEKRWAKPNGMPELAATPRREKDGRQHRDRAQRDPQMGMLKARARRWGKPSSQWREMRDPWWGCEAGGAMALATTDLEARKAYWDAICWMRRTVIALDRALGAPNRHAQCLRLLLPQEEMSADASTPALDERTDQEKEDAAVAAYARLQEAIGRGGPAARDDAIRAVLDDKRPRRVAAMLTALLHVSVMIDPGAWV